MFRNATSLSRFPIVFEVREEVGKEQRLQQDFPNHSTGHIPLEASHKYGEGRKKVRHQYSYYPVHEVKPALQYLLEIVGQDTELYGESYTYNGRMLQFSGSFIPKNLRHDTQILSFCSSAGSEAYLPGVGLPGNAFATGGFQFHTLQNVIKDPFYNTGGIRLQSASKIFNGAISIALDHSIMNISSATFNHIRLPHVSCMGVIIVYSNKPVYRSASFATYLNTIRSIADGLSSLMSQRAIFKKGTNSRLERNLRLLRHSILFISHFVTSYHKSHKEKPTLNVKMLGLPRTGSMSFFVTTRDIDDIRLSPRDEEAAWGVSKHDSSRHSKSNHREERRAAVDRSEHRDRKYSTRDEGMTNIPPSSLAIWIQDYLKKFIGGSVNMPARMTWDEGLVTFLGAFIAVSSTLLLFSLINDAIPDADTLTLPASFGALATLLYALPAAPLAQVI